MAVAFDAVASASAAFVSSVAFSLVVGSGANRAAMVGIKFEIATGTSVSSVTIGSDSLSLIAGTRGVHGNCNVELWGGILTVTGTQTVTVTFSNASSATIVCGAVSVTGADQTTPVNNGTVDITGATSIAITSNANDLTLDTIGSSFADISAPTQTQRWLINAGGARGGGSTGPGTAGPITHAWTVASYTNHVAIAGANFKQAAAAADDIGAAYHLVGSGGRESHGLGPVRSR